MKTKLVVALATLLSVVSATAQQKYLLPIGSNVNNRPAKVNVGLGDRDTGWAVNNQFDYIPTMGDLEKVIQYRVSVLAGKFNPPVGSEQDQYVLQITAEPGPYTVVRFHLDQGKIPPEVLEVKLQYGAAVVWYCKGITKITMQVTDASGTTDFSSQDGSGYETPCGLGVTRELLAEGLTIVEREYALPEFQKERGITAGSVTLWQNERYATFDLLDGHFIGVSAEMPDFMSSLRAPEVPQAPVLVVNTPKITRIVRVGNTTELTVSADSNSVAYLEFAESISGVWNAVPAYPTPLSLKSGSTQFTHTTESPTTFYRLRFSSSSQ